MVTGEEVILPCEAIGQPRPEIEWRKDISEIDFFDSEHKYIMMVIVPIKCILIHLCLLSCR